MKKNLPKSVHVQNAKIYRILANSKRLEILSLLKDGEMAVVLKCPACLEKFRYDISVGWPDLCPLCHVDIKNRRADDDVVCPNILSFKTKKTDAVARDIMNGSEQRVEMAAAMAAKMGGQKPAQAANSAQQGKDPAAAKTEEKR